MYQHLNEFWRKRRRRSKLRKVRDVQELKERIRLRNSSTVRIQKKGICINVKYIECGELIVFDKLEFIGYPHKSCFVRIERTKTGCTRLKN